ncbi:MAG TPA: hypothetical protein VNA25_02745 [Phycisphaerae bacterium]|nr:hypothetical protein [Phycisphaerae bacterium]
MTASRAAALSMAGCAGLVLSLMAVWVWAKDESPGRDGATSRPSAPSSRPAGSTSAPATRPKRPHPPATQRSRVTEADFLRVMRANCARCHRPCASVQELKRRKWLIPGKPDASPVYKVIGRHKRAGARYHNLSEADRKVVRDFVQSAGRAASGPSAPGSARGSR